MNEFKSPALREFIGNPTWHLWKQRQRNRLLTWVLCFMIAVNLVWTGYIFACIHEFQREMRTPTRHDHYEK